MSRCQILKSRIKIGRRYESGLSISGVLDPKRRRRLQDRMDSLEADLRRAQQSIAPEQRHNSHSRYHRRPPAYCVRFREYQKKYAKTEKCRAKVREWRRTPQGRAYRLRASMRRYYRHRALIDTYKVKVGCVDCGFNRWPEALDFDHGSRSSKRDNVARLLVSSKGVIMREIRKCVVRCANCHRHKTKRRNPNGFR